MAACSDGRCHLVSGVRRLTLGIIATMATRVRDEIPNGLLTTQQAAEWMGVSVRTFVTLGIRQIRFGERLVRYDVRDLQQFADLHGDRPPMRATG